MSQQKKVAIPQAGTTIQYILVSSILFLNHAKITTFLSHINNFELPLLTNNPNRPISNNLSMVATIILAIIVLICIAMIVWLLSGNSTKQQFAETSLLLAKSKEENDVLREQNSTLREENGRLKERAKFFEEEKEKLATESEIRFKNLANEILNNNSRTFKEQNETRLAEILAPLKENIEQFKKTVNDNYSNEARERFSLQERIKELIELNQSIGKEAKDLTSALKGNSKVQGDWGEMVLENILEKSGLQRDREFVVQQTTDENGKTLRNDAGNALRPDVVVNYPDGRCVVIDSKVSLTAYVNYINAETAEQQEAYRKQHLASVRSHIAELRNKKYQDYVGGGKTDFVMMFIPNEAAYIAAMQMDSNLWQEAYDVRVLLISPTHLISVLKLISQLWSHDRQTRNAIDIAVESGKMYDKFVGFIDEMKKIERTLNQTHDAYNNAMKKLNDGTGNLVSRAEKLRKMGAKATKSLPESTDSSNEE